MQQLPVSPVVDTNQLVLGSAVMVRSIALGIFHNHPFVLPLDDLIQEGMLAAAECANRFDPSKNVPFTAFAKHRVRGCMLEFYRDKKVYHEVAVELDDDRNDFIETMAADPTSHTKIQNSCVLTRVWEVIDSLPDRERTILTLTFREGYSQVEIGTALNISNSRICQIIADGVTKIRKALDLERPDALPLPQIMASNLGAYKDPPSQVTSASQSTEQWDAFADWEESETDSNSSMARLRTVARALLQHSKNTGPAKKAKSISAQFPIMSCGAPVLAA